MHLVVIGGVAAGLSAASRARRLDPKLEITVVEKSRHISWAACGLPYFLEGRVAKLDQLQIYSRDFFESQRKIRIRTEAEVVAVSYPRRQLRLRTGEIIPFDKLIFATGAFRACHIPGAFRIDTWEDAEQLKSHLERQRPRQAAIVGSSYIGLEAAEMLRAHGLKVTLYEARKDVLGREDPWLTGRVVPHLQRCRIEFRPETRVTDLVSPELTLLACGLQPNSNLAREAGVETGARGAICVNERMETNLADIYAAGDCAETLHLVTGRPDWIPLGTTANKMGRVAGTVAAGGREKFPGIVGTGILRVCGLCVAFTGLSEAMARSEGFLPVSVTVEAREKAVYFQGRPTSVQLTADRRTGRLLGACLVGEEAAAGRINVLAVALSQRMTVDQLAWLDLAYAPPYSTVWDPVLIAAQQLRKLL
ncbi:MAG: FAD-dependent oxidoreductase [Bryobacteraceae bacterium]|nr:FAD-dependent oxidoreductase [Bryobacteraceae bacterium]MDW8377829.1 FAD-dependent oxidoreductase [Bryobacterales bacterium]